MQKGIFKKSLAILLSVMLLFTAFGGALAVFAEDAPAEEVAFDYGTFEDGFNTRSESGANDGNLTIHQVPVLDNPTNLNWEEGLKYWTSKSDRSGAASEYVSLYEDEASGLNWVSFNLDNNQYDGISTPWFKFDSSLEGKEVLFFMDYMVNAKLANTVSNTFGTAYPIGVTLYQNKDGVTTKLFTKSEGPYHNGTNKHGGWFTQKMMANKWAIDTNATYRIEIQDTIPSDKAAVYDEEGNETSAAVTTRADVAAALEGEAAIYFRNFRICEKTDATCYDVLTGEALNIFGSPIGGTEGEGVIVPIFSSAYKPMYNTSSSYTTFPLINADLYPVAEGFNNGDFSKGFQYWTIRFNESKWTYDSINDIFELTEEGAIKYTGSAYAYWGLASVPFTLPGVKAGDKIRLELDIRNSSSNFRFYFGEKGGNSSDNNVSNSSSTWATKNSAWVTVTNDTPTFTIVSQMGTTTTGVEFDNFKIIKDNGDGTYTNVVTGETTYSDGFPVQPIGGTAEDGIVVNNNHYVATSGGTLDTSDYKFGVADKFTNYDFSEGFRYYSLRYNSGFADIDRLSDFAEITADGTMKFTSHPYNYNGFVTMPFYVEGLEAGDELAAAIKFKGNAGGIEIRLYENNTRLAAYSCGSKPTEWGYTSTTAKAITSADSYFWIEMQNGTADNSGMEIDEIMLLRKIDERLYENLFTGDLHYSDGLRVGGTYDEGWKLMSGGNGFNAKYTGTFDDFNGDFEEGLRYWGYRGNVSTVGLKASDAATTVTADGNTYMNVLNDSTAAWKGVRTLGFKLDGVKAGDKLTVMFNYKDGDLSKHRVSLRVENESTTDLTWGNVGDAGTTATAMIAAENGNWGTAVNKDYITIGTELASINYSTYRYCSTDINDHIWFYIDIETNCINAGGLSVDNIQVVRYIDELTYETLDGETITFDAAWAGTYYNGMSGTGNHVNNYVTGYYIENADFSEGLKYWGATGGYADSTLASSHATLVEEEGNNYIKLDGVARTAYSGFRTPKFNIPAAELAEGDYIAVMFDLYDPDNTAASFQVVIEAVNFTVDGPSTTRPSITSGNALKVIEDKGNGWKTVVTQFTAPINSASSASNGDWQIRLFVEVKSSTYDAETETWTVENKSNAAFDNFQIVRNDEGGFGKDALAVALDGSAVGEVNYGDANKDGKVD